MGSQRAMHRRIFGLVATLARSALRLPAGGRRWAALPARDRWLTLQALVALLFVEATIRWMRIPKVARALGVQLTAESPAGLAPQHPEPETMVATGLPIPPQAQVAPFARAVAGQLAHSEKEALRATLRIVRRWPFGTGPCLRESLVLGHLLRSRRPILCFGVARRGPRLLAHAWVEVDGRPVNNPLGVVPLPRPGTRP